MVCKGSPLCHPWSMRNVCYCANCDMLGTWVMASTAPYLITSFPVGSLQTVGVAISAMPRQKCVDVAKIISDGARSCMTVRSRALLRSNPCPTLMVVSHQDAPLQDSQVRVMIFLSTMLFLRVLLDKQRYSFSVILLRPVAKRNVVIADSCMQHGSSASDPLRSAHRPGWASYQRSIQ